jgi:hypothetical protein
MLNKDITMFLYVTFKVANLCSLLDAYFLRVRFLMLILLGLKIDCIKTFLKNSKQTLFLNIYEMCNNFFTLTFFRF